MWRSIDIVMPVHNEGQSIEATLQEIGDVFAAVGLSPRLIMCEDGSRDDTVVKLENLSKNLNLMLITSPLRKGYSQAVIDGLRASDAEIVFCIDSDGQCDPLSLLPMLNMARENDVVLGWRNPRHDSVFRRCISRQFKLLYAALFSLYFKDPSYACLLIKRPALDILLQQKLGMLKQGLFWELNARINALGLRVAEVPVAHRARAAGKTQLYKLRKLPRIATQHIIALFRLRAELKQIHRVI